MTDIEIVIKTPNAITVEPSFIDGGETIAATVEERPILVEPSFIFGGETVDVFVEERPVEASVIFTEETVSVQVDGRPIEVSAGLSGGGDAQTLDGYDGSYYLDWDNFTGTPNSLSGYGITDAYTKTELQTSGQAIVDWGNISNEPSFGTAAFEDVPISGNASGTEVVVGNDTRLTDSRTPLSHGSTHTSTGGDAVPDVIAAGASGLMGGSDKTKLNGIESGAEANNISDVDATDLTDGGDTTLHIHDGRYYTETELQTSGQSSVHWGNITNEPSFIDGTGIAGRVGEWSDTDSLQSSTLIKSGAGVLTLSSATNAGLTIAVTAAKTLTLAAADNATLTVPGAGGTAALMSYANAGNFGVGVTPTAFLHVLGNTTSNPLLEIKTSLATTSRVFVVRNSSDVITHQMDAVRGQFAFGNVLPSTLPSGAPGFQVYGNNSGAVNRIQNFSNTATTTSSVQLYHSRGTYDAPTPPNASGYYLGQLTFGSYRSAGVAVARAAIQSHSTESWTATVSEGANLLFQVCPSGTATNVTLMTLQDSYVGIGDHIPLYKLHVLESDAATNAITTTVTLDHNTSGIVAASGLGSRILGRLEDATTADQEAFSLDWYWTDSTHAAQHAAAVIRVNKAGTMTEVFRAGSTEVVVNETGSATIDMRVETDSYDALFVDASNDSVMIMSNAAGKVGFFGGAAVVQQTALTTQLTTLTASAPGTPDYSIQDLVAGGFGFVAADEGQSMLSAFINLQTRVAELETKLQAYTLLA